MITEIARPTTPLTLPSPPLAMRGGDVAFRYESALEELYSHLAKEFYKPDLQAVRIVLGTIASHCLKIGDPAWLFVVAPPGSGKTTITMMGTCGLDGVTPLGDFSENTFLSGFYGHKEPGILEKLGTTTKEGNVSITRGDRIFVAKDFTTVLSMRREKRGAILSQLREIHDGEFKRDFGTGESKAWKGRVTIIAAVTPALDKHTAVFSSLGERFLQVRWHRPDSEEAGVWAIDQQGGEGNNRKAIQGIFFRVFQELGTSVPVLRRSVFLWQFSSGGRSTGTTSYSMVSIAPNRRTRGWPDRLRPRIALR